MKQNFKETMAKVGKFFKKNGYYFLIVICIAAVASMIGVAIAQNNKKNTAAKVDDNYVNAPDNSNNNETPPPVDENGNEEPVPVDKLTFALPTSGTVSIGYSVTEAFYNQTLKQLSYHEAMDFVSDGDLNVYAAAKGVVKEVDYDILSGNYVVIEHADGYQTVYKSLGDGVEVTVGQTVEKGDVLGVMSDSMGSECLDGVHLHFEVLLDGEYINPLEVLLVEEK